MKGFSGNIKELTVNNSNFRQVLYTGRNSQLVVMSLAVGEEIGAETHTENDQFFRFEKGQGTVIIDGNQYQVGDGDAVVIPAGAEHNVINTSATEALKAYTIYSPAHHMDGTVHATKQAAQASHEHYDGRPTEDA